jgi:hypothetical protein
MMRLCEVIGAPSISAIKNAGRIVAAGIVARRSISGDSPPGQECNGL